MKEQARELMQQVDVFKMNRRIEASSEKHEANMSRGGHSPDVHHATSNPIVNTVTSISNHAEDKKPVGVGNKKDSRKNEEEFEEF